MTESFLEPVSQAESPEPRCLEGTGTAAPAPPVRPARVIAASRRKARHLKKTQRRQRKQLAKPAKSRSRRKSPAAKRGVPKPGALSSSATGSQPVPQEGPILLDPCDIDSQRWANRLPDSYRTADFRALCADIERTGGNQVPVLVRPIGAIGAAASSSQQSPRYELLYGHRRFEACRRHGLQLAAIIQPLDDTDAIVKIQTENRSRKNLAPIEQGAFYKRLLDARAYPSLRRLAFELGNDPGDASRKVFLASLPPAILNAIESPLRLSCQHAKLLAPLWEDDKEELIRRAEEVSLQFGRLKVKELLAVLTGTDFIQEDVGNSNGAAVGETVSQIVVDGAKVGTLRTHTDQRLTLSIEVPLAASAQAELLAAVTKIVNSAMQPSLEVS